MKRIFLIATVISAFFAIGLAPVGAEAAEDAGYAISMEGDTAVLSSSGAVLGRGEIGELLTKLPDNSSIKFVDAVSAASIEIPKGTYTFSGGLDLLSGSITVREGSVLLLSNFKIDSSDASCATFSVRGGTLGISSSEISAAGVAILSDYSQGGVTSLEDTSVKCSSADAAVILTAGSLSVKSGSIKNTLGAAIESHGALTLSADPEISGVPTDIFTDKAISLSLGDAVYNARYALEVVFLGVFSEGYAYEIFNKATEGAISRISLFDKNGKAYDLTYFDSHPSFGEKSVAAVYLPFALKFTDGTKVISTVYALKGEGVSLPDAPEKEGYEFSFWSTAHGEQFDQSLGASESVTLYPHYKLCAPAFKISSVSATYTGEEHTLTFSEVSHPLDAQGGFCEFVWYKSGQIVSRGASVPLKNVSDSGEYSCLVTYSYASDSSSVLVEGISVTISPKQIDAPTLPDAVYDGTLKMPFGIDSALFVFECDGFTDAGVYKISLTLRDSENCVFSKTGLSSCTVSFEITRAKNEFKTLPAVKSVYEGMALDIKCEPLFGEAYFTFSKERGGEYTRAVPTTHGKYYLVARVDESKNFSSLVSEPIAFEIKEDICISLEISAREDREYCAFDRFLGEGVLLLAKYKSGREESVDISALSVRYQRGNHLRYGDSGVILSYGGISTTYPLSVKKANYDLSSLNFPKQTTTYDGKYHEYSLAGISIVGKDSIPLVISAVGGGTNAGEYKIRIVFSTESTDYSAPSEMECTMVIERAVAELKWTNLSFVYDGKKKKPTCSYTDVFGVVRYPEVLGEQTGAGAGYTARVNADVGNYNFKNGSVEFEIKKGSYDLSSVRWVGGEFVYNGKAQGVMLEGLPMGVSIAGYTDAEESCAGEYLAYATLLYDADNYEKPEIEPHAWSIHKASYDLSGFSVESDSVTFDGNPHYPKVVGKDPIGLDGIPLQYRFSRAVTHASEGAVSIKVEFYTESPNYKTPDAKVVYVTVLPRAVKVVWQGAEFIYSGRPILPSAECAECKIEVTGSGINAGEYTATAKSKDSDYYIENPSFPYKINKAHNQFIGEIRVDDAYTEREITYEARTMLGEPAMLVFSDRECTLPTSIKESGKYYIVFVVKESENYYELRSDVIEISVIDLAITGVSARLLRDDFVAFERLTADDLVFTVSYNDGSKIKCDISDIDIIYQAADSLRRSDTEVKFKFGDHEASVSITVGYASYDLSSVIIEGLTHTYDGVEKQPIVTGLPKGVLLLGFAEGGGTLAGEYTLTPILSYDKENYHAPTLDAVKMVINKQIVPLQYQISVEYDGTAHSLTSSDTRYSFVIDREIRNAGEYTVTARLADEANYAFPDGDSVTVSVMPRVISLTVTEAGILSDGTLSNVKYEITGGSIIEGDELSVSPILIDGIVSLTTENKNYTLSVIGYEPTSLSRHLGDLKVALIAMGIALLVLSLAALVYVGRRRIFSKFFVSATAIAEKSPPLPPVKITDLDKLDDKKQDSEPKAEEKEEKEEKQEKQEESPTEETQSDPDTGASDLMERAEKIGKVEIDMEKADSLITDALARDLIKRSVNPIKTSGHEKCVINVDTLSEYFYPGERVDINTLKKRGLVSQTAFFVKVLARGRVDKPLSVYANEFTPAAVKMIVLSGGEAVKAQTVKEKED